MDIVRITFYYWFGGEPTPESVWYLGNIRWLYAYDSVATRQEKL